MCTHCVFESSRINGHEICFMAASHLPHGKARSHLRLPLRHATQESGTDAAGVGAGGGGGGRRTGLGATTKATDAAARGFSARGFLVHTHSLPSFEHLPWDANQASAEHAAVLARSHGDHRPFFMEETGQRLQVLRGEYLPRFMVLPRAWHLPVAPPFSRPAGDASESSAAWLEGRKGAWNLTRVRVLHPLPFPWVPHLHRPGGNKYDTMRGERT